MDNTPPYITKDVELHPGLYYLNITWRAEDDFSDLSVCYVSLMSCDMPGDYDAGDDDGNFILGQTKLDAGFWRSGQNAKYSFDTSDLETNTYYRGFVQCYNEAVSLARSHSFMPLTRVTV